MGSKISIIIPVYNKEDYLSECIDSIINQSYKNLEIIIIDDGSTDRSVEIIKRYESLDRRIKFFKQENLGVSSARNLGIENSTGEFITFVDSDDWVDLYMYEKMIEKINKFNADLIMCSFIREYKDRKEYEKLPFEREELLCDKDINNKLILNMISKLDDGLDSIMGSVWRCIFRKDIILKNNILFDTDISISEDLLFCIKYLRICNKVYVYNEALYNYRFTTGSALNRYDSELWEKQLLINKKIINIFNNNMSFQLRERLYSRLLFVSINSIFNIYHKDNKENVLDKYKKVKRILNDNEMKKLRKNYIIQNKKYKIFKYNTPILICFIINMKNKYNKLKKVIE